MLKDSEREKIQKFFLEAEQSFLKLHDNIDLVGPKKTAVKKESGGLLRKKRLSWTKRGRPKRSKKKKKNGNDDTPAPFPRDLMKDDGPNEDLTARSRYHNSTFDEGFKFTENMSFSSDDSDNTYMQTVENKSGRNKFAAKIIHNAREKRKPNEGVQYTINPLVLTDTRSTALTSPRKIGAHPLSSKKDKIKVDSGDADSPSSSSSARGSKFRRKLRHRSAKDLHNILHPGKSKAKKDMTQNPKAPESKSGGSNFSRRSNSDENCALDFSEGERMQPSTPRSVLRLFKTGKGPKPKRGGSLTEFICAGFLNKQNKIGRWKRRWVTLDNKRLLCYKNNQDPHPSTVIDLLFSSVKPYPIPNRFCFKIITQDLTYAFEAETEEEINHWAKAIDEVCAGCLQESVEKSVSERSELEDISGDLRKKIALDLQQVYSMQGNDVCADCHAPKPQWVLMNRGVFICIDCAGVHRRLGSHISVVRSLWLDRWTMEQIDFMRRNGNTRFNRTWEHITPPGYAKPLYPSITHAQRERWITAKYERTLFVKRQESARSDGLPQHLFKEVFLQLFREDEDFRREISLLVMHTLQDNGLMPSPVDIPSAGSFTKSTPEVRLSPRENRDSISPRNPPLSSAHLESRRNRRHTLTEPIPPTEEDQKEEDQEHLGRLAQVKKKFGSRSKNTMLKIMPPNDIDVQVPLSARGRVNFTPEPKKEAKISRKKRKKHREELSNAVNPAIVIGKKEKKKVSSIAEEIGGARAGANNPPKEAKSKHKHKHKKRNKKKKKEKLPKLNLDEAVKDSSDQVPSSARSSHRKHPKKPAKVISQKRLRNAIRKKKERTPPTRESSSVIFTKTASGTVTPSPHISTPAPTPEEKRPIKPKSVGKLRGRMIKKNTTQK
eukprot:TRINITY_DN2075_c0_g1_i1.p1 TRINITY_DN2075_c0_g1~~TRINITY_DN2075_c0_g1_i1.p1  ORF type:complete len:888 (+),score=176.31 TRINITY_DN2075_c0_g1_i1:252-2915(+)